MAGTGRLKTLEACHGQARPTFGGLLGPLLCTHFLSTQKRFV